jgi:methionine biosynthesis protein MetW
MKRHTHIGYDLVIDEVSNSAKVLDLGCGDGALLQKLQQEKNAMAYGVEISEDGVSKCIEKGLYCYQGDIDEGLSDYKDNSFDYVILNQTLQSTKKPEHVMREIMRISRNAIISFPNFGYILTRLQLLYSGKMPKNSILPYEWYETPDIHHLTIKDFREYCRNNRFVIKKERHFKVKKSGYSKEARTLTNLKAQFGFFILNGEAYTGGEK